MSYLFTCPHCQSQTMVDDRYSGQSGECVNCGGDIQIPQFATVVASQRSPRKSYAWVGAVIFVLTVGSIAFSVFRFGGETITQINNSRERTSSMRNLETIAAALNEYADLHGTYPPPVTRDAKGMPLHSWRTLILPFLDEMDIYNQMDLNKPHDDAGNLAVASNYIPSVYQHPNGANFGQSAYYLIVGAGTLFPSSGPLSPEQVTDGASKTILVIEGAPTTTSNLWSEPLDLNYTKMQGQIGGATEFDPGGWIDDGAAMVTVDGRGHFLPNSTPAHIFKALVTPRGNERLADDTLD